MTNTKWFSINDAGVVATGRNFPACQLTEEEEKQLNAVAAEILQYYEPAPHERELVGVFSFENKDLPPHRFRSQVLKWI